MRFVINANEIQSVIDIPNDTWKTWTVLKLFQAFYIQKVRPCPFEEYMKTCYLAWEDKGLQLDGLLKDYGFTDGTVLDLKYFALKEEKGDTEEKSHSPGMTYHAAKEIFGLFRQNKRKRRTLTEWQARALESFAAKGLTEEMLLTRLGPFLKGHYKALSYLHLQNGIDIEGAFFLLENLGEKQAIELANSQLSFQNLNRWQKKILVEMPFFSSDLLMKYEHGFGEGHYRILSFFRYKKPEKLYGLIHNLPEKQAHALCLGWEPSVLSFVNIWHFAALVDLGEHGLTKSMLMGYESFEFFDLSHYTILFSFIKKESELSIKDKWAAFKSLSKLEISAIFAGLDVEDIRGLNQWQAKAIIRFKREHNLNKDMLLSLNSDRHDFDENHYEALVSLVTVRMLPMRDALALLRDNPPHHAFGFEKGLVLEDFQELQNIWQVKALAEYPRGCRNLKRILKQTLLKGQREGLPFTEVHYQKIVSFIQNNGSHKITLPNTDDLEEMLGIESVEKGAYCSNGKHVSFS